MLYSSDYYIVLTDSAIIILAGHISVIMSKLSEIHCQCQCFQFVSSEISIPTLFLLSSSVLHFLLHPSHRTSCPIFFLHFLGAVVAFEQSLLCFIWRAAFAPLLHRTVIEQPNLTIRVCLPPLACQGTAHCHSAGNWKGNEMWYLLCMSPLPHLRDRADVSFTIFKENETRGRMMEMHWGIFLSDKQQPDHTCLNPTLNQAWHGKFPVTIDLLVHSESKNAAWCYTVQ